MQPQQTVSKTTIKKKVKNKEWGFAGEQPTPEIRTNVENQNQTKVEKKYQSISKLSQKYSFNIEAVLGSGFASTVYLGTCIQTQAMVCIKAIDLLALGITSPYISFIHNQVNSLRLFDSDFVVKLYDVYESNTFYYLVMELCAGGDLYKMLKLSPMDLPQHFITSIMKQIVCGLGQIHEKGLIHRDMKTENIFISKFPEKQNDEMKVKIGDLGFCILLTDIEKQKSEGKIPENVGSPIYMSPQISQSHSYSFQSDIYSLGIIWYELYHKHAPWEAKTEADLLHNKINEPVQLWRSDMSQKVKDLISKCISNNVNERPSCAQILAIIQNKDQISL